MRQRFPRWLSGVLLVLVAGCSNQAVQEDRSINHTTDGSSVGFQHGSEGVFVAQGDGGKLEKIYDTGEDAIAVSSPLWAPNDKRLIFTVARPAQSESTSAAMANIQAWDANPEGRSFGPEDIVYTCMLRAAPDKSGEAGEPTPLFQAACSHPGYVAANLAVRWHPAGDRILFVDRTEAGFHRLFEYDIASGKRRSVLEQDAGDLLFDWSPGGKHLVCAIAHGTAMPSSGIWIRAVDGDTWWQVPQSQQLAMGRSDALLERLRSTRPAWTRDDQRMACVILLPPPAQNIPPGSTADNTLPEEHAILLVDVARQTVKTVHSTVGRIHDLQWHPDGKRLGFISRVDDSADSPGGATGEQPLRGVLQIVDDSGTLQTAPAADQSVRRFAGWNHDGSRLAYITPEPAPPEDSPESWALLFARQPLARDRVLLADDGQNEVGKVVHDGVRITFPQWSPTNQTLSLWGTYTPSHRSWLSHLLPWSLRLGDPAAILDTGSGQMTWMAVNAHEKAQVGHYYLLKRDYAEAWKWYQQAAEGREPATPIKLSEMQQFLRGMRVHQDPTFFEYYCLMKLGRREEAAERLSQFRATLRFDLNDIETFGEETSQADGTAEGSPDEADDATPQGTTTTDDAPDAQPVDGNSLPAVRKELIRVAQITEPWLQHSFATEVFLSLNAVDDGISYFEKQLASASTDNDRYAIALCLSQLLLIGDRHAQYATLASDTLAPLLLKRHRKDALREFAMLRSATDIGGWLEQQVVAGSGAAALLPLASREFLGSLPEADLKTLTAKWEALREQTGDEREELIVDLVQLATLTVGKAPAEQLAEVKKRIDANPQRKIHELNLSSLDDVDRLAKQAREATR